MSQVNEMNQELEQKKLKLNISRAKVVIEELEMKIHEKQLDIARMREHMELQQEVIKKAEDEYKKLLK